MGCTQVATNGPVGVDWPEIVAVMAAPTAAYAVIPPTFSKPAEATVAALAVSSAVAPTSREVGRPGRKIRKVFSMTIQCETQKSKGYSHMLYTNYNHTPRAACSVTASMETVDP